MTPKMTPARTTGIPAVVRDVLRDSLTGKGICQWWTARNRALDGFTPEECWVTDSNRERVLNAARKLSRGQYL